MILIASVAWPCCAFALLAIDKVLWEENIAHPAKVDEDAAMQPLNDKCGRRRIDLSSALAGDRLSVAGTVKPAWKYRSFKPGKNCRTLCRPTRIQETGRNAAR
jgi:hypothetical protein